MKSILIILLLFCSLNITIWGQLVDERGYYLVESENFSSPVKDIIALLEGKVAEGFLAPDIYDTEHDLYDYRGRATLLFFFELEEENGRNLLETLKLFSEDFYSRINVIGIAKDSKEDLLKYLDGAESKFPLIYNGEIFCQSNYGQDLGTPRLFIIDASGIIKRVIPASAFNKEKQVKELIRECVNNITE